MRPARPPVVGPGTVVANRILLCERIGSGAMGVLFRGLDRVTGREVAVKFLDFRRAHDRSMRGRFLTEARALARVLHPNVVRVDRFGLHEGAPYFTMQLVPGMDLDDWIGASDEPPSIASAHAVVDGVARGLAAIHAAGIVHNDLKSGNVIVTAGGGVTIVDFGLARPVSAVCRLDPDYIVGTPAYMAPELAQGSARIPSVVTDIYALGVLTFEVFTGRLPFEADDPTTLLQMQIHTLPPRPSSLRPDLPAGLDELLMRTLAKHPGHRLTTVAEFIASLEQLRHRPASDQTAASPAV